MDSMTTSLTPLRLMQAFGIGNRKLQLALTLVIEPLYAPIYGIGDLVGDKVELEMPVRDSRRCLETLLNEGNNKSIPLLPRDAAEDGIEDALGEAVEEQSHGEMQSNQI
ncbi:hypothetical protein L1887_31931 [Cichorium endivia]|nr:hypothetical protein L1887_31931 [Cichorium endivia]